MLPEFNPQVNFVNYIGEGHQGYLYVGPGWGAGSDTVANFDLFAAEVDSTWGYDLWTCSCGWPVTFEDGYCIKPTADGGYIIAADPWTLLKLKGGGNHYWVSWKRIYGGIGRYVEPTSDGGYVVAGGKEGDLFIVKTDSLGYVEIEEESPVTHQPDLQVTPIGSQIVLRYSDRPDGFHAFVFDATGRKVDEIHSPIASGTISWGEEVSAGVYFIVPETEGIIRSQKVVLTR